MEAYTLSDIQYKVLEASVSGEAAAFVPEPSPTGTKEEREQSLADLKQFEDLVELGLMRETTADNADTIKTFSERYGYGIRFFIATDNGACMFKKKHLVVN